VVNILPLLFAEKHLKNSCEFQTPHFLKRSAALPKIEGVVMDTFDGKRLKHLKI